MRLWFDVGDLEAIFVISMDSLMCVFIFHCNFLLPPNPLPPTLPPLLLHVRAPSSSPPPRPLLLLLPFCLPSPHSSILSLSHFHITVTHTHSPFLPPLPFLPYLYIYSPLYIFVSRLFVFFFFFFFFFSSFTVASKSCLSLPNI